MNILQRIAVKLRVTITECNKRYQKSIVQSNSDIRQTVMHFCGEERGCSELVGGREL